MAQPTVWLITGTTSGFGSAMMEQFTARGDKVIAAGRNASQRLADKKSASIYPLDLDMTAPLAVFEKQAEEAIAAFGHIDVVVNNAGVSVPQAIEEAEQAFTAKVFDANLIGAMRLVQATLPHFRERKQGTFAFIGSGLGWESYPFLAHYATAKAGLSMFAEGLQKEVAHLGIRSVIFEPGAFATGMGQTRTAADEGLGGAPKIAGYQGYFQQEWGKFGDFVSQGFLSDTEKLPSAIWDVVKGEGLASGKPFPVRVPLGADSLAAIRQKCREQLQLCDEWEQVSLSVAKDGVEQVVNAHLMKRFSILDLTDSK
ncbi:Oxidoreductase BOA17 [Colletotrichum spinosum]|uniref:Oxidoreductase BOA17 n=1 Tax=Colletotrichum spinosum TaxID=1347390 RepID=A0A4R8QSF0_9PEZI|nr:Oxidoreductase BOA17 [Colletotrichum spinosum]